MTTITMRTVRRNLTIWGVAALFVAVLSVNVDATTADTCAELDGFGSNQTASVSGPWGSITFDDTSDTLDVTVADGWEVRICVKAGSAQQGDGPEDLGWFGEGDYSLTHSSGKELSHFGYDVREVPDDTTTTTSTTSTTTTTTTLPDTTTSTTVEVNPICIDCNNATLADLMQLTGVNATLAQAIIDNRPYERLTDLVDKGVLTGPQLLLILVVNANTGAFASDDCLSFAVPSTTTTTAPSQSTTSTPGDTTTTTAPGGPSTTHNTPSPEDGTLPFTGGPPIAPLAGSGVALLTLGSLLVRTFRRDGE